MSFANFLPLLISLGIFLVPIWLLRRQGAGAAREYFTSGRYIPPQAIQNASVAYSLRMAAFAPIFVYGANGDFTPVIIGAACLGLGIYLLHTLRGPLLAFLRDALKNNQSITLPAFIALRHGNDRRVRVFAAILTLFVLVAAIACEAFALSGIFKLISGHDSLARGLAFVALLLAVLYAVPAGHPGVIYAGQLKLGAIFLGLFGAGAMLLYQYISALTPLPPYGAFAIGFAAACSLAILIYRRSRYIETGPIIASRAANLLGKFGKALNPAISVFVVLIIVLAGMGFTATGFSTPGPAIAAQGGSSLSLMGLGSLVLLPLFYPLTDLVHWQRLAAIENNREAYQGDDASWAKALRGIFRLYALETPLLLVFIASLGAVSVAALNPADSTQALPALVQEAGSGDNPVATLALSLLLLAIAAITLSTIAASFLAGLCTLRYDLLPGRTKPESSSMAGRVFFLAIVIALIAIAELLPLHFTSGGFVALVFALLSPLLAFVPLILGPIAAGRTVSPAAVLVILGIGAACPLAGLFGYMLTAGEHWLWGTVPVCLAAACSVFALALRLQGSRMR